MEWALEPKTVSIQGAAWAPGAMHPGLSPPGGPQAAAVSPHSLGQEGGDPGWQGCCLQLGWEVSSTCCRSLSFQWNLHSSPGHGAAPLTVLRDVS